jgi:glycosyltransferase family protein
MRGKSIRFQPSSRELASRLEEAAQCRDDRHVIAFLDVFGSLSRYRKQVRRYWRTWRRTNWKHSYDVFGGPRERVLGAALVTRFYHDHRDRRRAPERLKAVRRIWDDQNLLVVEGSKTLLGAGNDLLANANSIQRIQCPDSDAFRVHDDIYRACLDHGQNRLILIALGPTATVLAHDLAHAGYWALDIGHIDIEYEWMLRSVEDKTVVDGKASAEASVARPATYLHGVGLMDVSAEVVATVGR